MIKVPIFILKALQSIRRCQIAKPLAFGCGSAEADYIWKKVGYGGRAGAGDSRRILAGGGSGLRGNPLSLVVDRPVGPYSILSLA